MHSITELNKKVSYRIAKVIFAILLVLFMFIAGTVNYEASFREIYDESRTHINCVGGYNEDVLKSRYGIYGAELTLEQKKKIGSEICKISATISMDSFEKYTPYGSLLLSNNLFFSSSKGVMREEFSLKAFLGWFFIILLALVALFESIRRTFYYVIFGTFTPKKT